jgi:alcohol dehydrogenase (cytochrome c)
LTSRIALGALAVLVGAAFAVAMSVEAIHWRADVIGMKAAGKIPDLGWIELLSMMRPGSPYHLKPLRNTPDPVAVIHNPRTSSSDLRAGKQLFESHCTSCHGDNGGGGQAPSLVGRTLNVGDADWSLFRAVTGRLPDLGMPPVSMSDVQAWQVVAYVRSLRSGMDGGEDGPGEHAFPADVRVPASRIENAASEPQSWLTYSGSYRGWRYSSLDQITSQNVTHLKLAWALQLQTSDRVEGSPIVVDGVMYMTSPPSDVLAIDAAAGKTLWRYRRSVPQVPNCCGRVNRGVAILDDRIFINTLDDYLVALDARSGRVLWQTQVAEYKDSYSMTAAPLAVGDKIVVGVGGGEFAIRGFVDAYDASTGKRLWRFYTVPAPGEKGSETWTGDTWKTGGGPAWLTGSFDPELGLIYWGVGNPAPEWNGDARPGDNLFTDSVIALNANTGRLAWHFQFTPHDEHDWDATQIPVLVDREYEGRMRKLMLWANRNGFYYVLDRETGQFLHASAYVKQTWAESIGGDGRPIPTRNAAVSRGGTLTWPGLGGGGNWWSPSYNPTTDLLYVPFAEAPNVFIKGAQVDPDDLERGVRFGGSGTSPGSEWNQAGIRALDPATGKIVWEYLRSPRRDRSRMGGALSTAGNLVFAGDINDFVAFHAASGEELWRTGLGGQIHAPPVTYAVGGVQIVIIAAGHSLFAFRL